MPLMPASRSSNSAAAATANKPLIFVRCLLTALVFCTAGAVAASTAAAPLPLPSALAATKSSVWNYRVTGRSEQNRDLFTQGFVFDRDTLWISSGLYQQSHIVAIDHDNRIAHEIALPNDIFGEGITIANNTLWVLSWREQRVLRYNLTTHKPLRPLHYSGEGWGLTQNGKQLIRSDGTSTLHFHRSTDFKVMRTLQVTDAGTAIINLNELEWINGLIYANIWLTNTIVIIDPANGHVIGRLDLTGLLPAQDTRGDTDVLNGIAWNARKKELWVTGKRWPARFRIEFTKPGS